MRISDWSSDVCSSDLVVLPARGPLSDLLTEIADEVAIERIVKLQRRDAFFLLLNKLPKAISVLTKRLRSIKEYNVVYVNTIVILDYLLALHFYSGSAIIHVREIPGNQIGRASCRERVCQYE